ncbi:MAG: hypothetical protein KAY32_15690 [Candidatus Eisenbacteria sp.]|nr:hypothetical protein [Candidatus Eisenbacteria bacterium]
MIRTPTVLILGAGASKPYAFPTGRELLVRICTDLEEQESPLTRTLVELGNSLSKLKGFGTALALSCLPSVDVFLEERPEFLQLGKAAIASALLPFEREHRLLRTRQRDMLWYEYLFGHLRAPPAKLDENRLKIVTFNYDRSLEQALFLAFMHSYGLDDTAAAKAVEKIPIVHVYGSLAPLPWQDATGLRYHSAANAANTQRCAENIRILHEGSREADLFTRAQLWIRHAKVICFLGFGYHQTNIARLGIPEELTTQEVFGTAVGLQKAEQERVKKMFETKDSQGSRIFLGDNGQDVLYFLREQRVFRP